MRYDLATLIRRQRNPRRSVIELRPVIVPATMATDLYQSAYRLVVAEWEQAAPRIAAEYERAFAQIAQDSPADIGQVIAETENSVATVMLTIRARLQRWTARLEAMHRRKWRGAILTATGVDVSTLISPADARMTMQAAVEANTGLIRSVSDATRRRIGNAVFEGFRQRANPRDVAKQITEAVGMERRRALRIAADQNVKLASALNEERRREAGIESWLWVHSGKKHPREDHKARDGFLYSENSDLVGETHKGKRVRKPPEDLPGQLPYCGCTSRAVVIF